MYCFFCFFENIDVRYQNNMISCKNDSKQYKNTFSYLGYEQTLTPNFKVLWLLNFKSSKYIYLSLSFQRYISCDVYDYLLIYTYCKTADQKKDTTSTILPTSFRKSGGLIFYLEPNLYPKLYQKLYPNFVRASYLLRLHYRAHGKTSPVPTYH